MLTLDVVDVDHPILGVVILNICLQRNNIIVDWSRLSVVQVMLILNVENHLRPSLNEKVKHLQEPRKASRCFYSNLIYFG